MATRLKVYGTRIGFHDVVVAAPNQKAALAAWDVRENLFAQGAAAPIDDPDAAKAALAQPGVVLSRPIGGVAYTAESQAPRSAPKVDRPKNTASKPKPAAAKPRPDRSALNATERALDDLAAEERRALDEFVRERRALEAREAGLRRQFETRRRKLERDRERALSAYRAAGG